MFRLFQLSNMITKTSSTKDDLKALDELEALLRRVCKTEDMQKIRQLHDNYFPVFRRLCRKYDLNTKELLQQGNIPNAIRQEIKKFINARQ